MQDLPDTLNQKEKHYEDGVEFIDLEGKVIRNIYIRNLEIAGASLKDDEEEKEPSWLGKIGNSLHFKTRQWVIRNHLLFEEGDSLDVFDMSNSERLLRESGYFLDAKINALLLEENKDSVDIVVVTQDKWTISFLVSYNTEKKNGYLGIKDDNLIGIGHNIDATISYDQRPEIGWGGAAKYTAANIAGSYINGTARYITNRNSTVKSLHFVRPFITPQTEWAGGLDLARQDGNLEYIENNIFKRIPYVFSEQNIWLGHSFPVWFGSNVFRKKTHVVAAGRVSRTKYSERPEVTIYENRIFENSLLYLSSIGLINQRYYKDIYIDKFGTTEDVLIGGILAFTIGIEDRDLSERWYAGVDAVYSRRVESIGYFSWKLGWGGFRHVNRWEQNTFNLNMTYHSQLFNNIAGSKEWQHRLFFQSDFMLGYNRFVGEQIYLDTENGLRGIPRFALSGTKRVTINTESRIFSPYSILGFILGGIVFADFGMITTKSVNLNKQKLYQSYGIGLRTRNESIAGASFRISAAYNPILPAGDDSHFKIIFSAAFILGKRSFGISQPSIIEFNGR